MYQAVFCIANDENQAKHITARLRQSGFNKDVISVLFNDEMGMGDLINEHYSEGCKDVVPGEPSCGAQGWRISIGSFAIPSVGPFLAAGPLMLMLADIEVDPAAGCIAMGLVGMDLSKIEAKRYQDKIKDGNVLVSVHAGCTREIDLAKRIFREAEAQDMCTIGDIRLAEGRAQSMAHEKAKEQVKEQDKKRNRRNRTTAWSVKTSSRADAEAGSGPGATSRSETSA